MRCHSRTHPETSRQSAVNSLTQDRFADLVQNERHRLTELREKSAPTEPKRQMSIRMQEEKYLEFRALCRAMRRTNGEMLSELLDMYLANTGI